MKTPAILSRRISRMARRKPARPARRPTLYELFKSFDGVATDLPADFAANHDYYLYGSPKQAER